MKTLSGTFKVVILAAIGISGVLVFRAFSDPDPDQPKIPSVPNKAKFVLRIHNRVEVKDGKEDEFEALLCKSQYDPKFCRIHMRRTDPADPHKVKEEILPTPAGTPCPSPTNSPYVKLDIKTDKVTVSEKARNIQIDELTPIAVHVTQQVASNDLSDITAVLNLLK
jgi:hypothetical protein